MKSTTMNEKRGYGEGRGVASKGTECPWQVEVGTLVVHPVTGEEKFIPMVNGFLGFDESHIRASENEAQASLMSWAVDVAKTLAEGEDKIFSMEIPTSKGNFTLAVRIYCKKKKVAWKMFH